MSVSEANHAKIERILVRGTNWIGDAVMSTPALQRLRASFPDARITLLATPLTCDLFASTSDSPVDQIMPYDRKTKGRRALWQAIPIVRREHFDLAVLFQNALEAALLAALAGIPRRVGFAAQGRSPLLTHRLQRGPEHRNRHQINDYLDLVAACEKSFLPRDFQPALSSPLPKLTAGPRDLADAETLLKRDAGRPLIALNVGATNSRAKCWPPGHFAALADRLSAATGGTIILIGGPGEVEAANAVATRIKERNVINLAGRTTLRELLGLLSLCAVVVTNDTGPAHIAAALGRPVLTLFGPTNEFETAPTGPHAALVRAADIECARCMYRDCPIDHRCMTRLSVDTVYNDTLGLLA